MLTPGELAERIATHRQSLRLELEALRSRVAALMQDMGLPPTA
jgi:hypothetical protein